VTSPLPLPGCPDDAELAALSDGTLTADGRLRIAAHVASCERCLDHVGALVRLGRAEAPVLPVALRNRVAFPLEGPRQSRTGWRTGGAVAATVCLSLGGWYFAQRTASVPPAAQVETAEQVRSRGVTAPVPNVVRPSGEQRVAAGPLDVQWLATANAIGYRVRVMRDDGTLVWEGESATTATQVPRSAGLPPHTPLYVSVTALMPDGKTARSPSVRFEIASE
jgi:hypothetical protein